MRAKPIIVGMDGSAEAVQAAVVASQFSAANGAAARYVYAAPEPWPPGFAPLTLMPGMYDDVRRFILDALRHALPDVRDEDVVVRTGRSGEVLVREAQEQGAWLVVVGGRRHGTLARGLGGSTAHYLARALHVPLLVVLPGTQAIRRVLVAADLSAAAELTLRTAVAHARLLGAALRVLHVVEPARFPSVVPVTIDEQELERRSREVIEQVVGRVPQAASAEREFVRGVPAEAISEAVAAWRADLVIAGSHGKGWAHRMLIGSTTERLLNLLPASLLVVPITRTRRARSGRGARTRRRRRLSLDA